MGCRGGNEAESDAERADGGGGMAENHGYGGERGHGLPKWCQEPQVRFSGKYPCDARRMTTSSCGEIMVRLERDWGDTWAGEEYGKAAVNVGE